MSLADDIANAQELAQVAQALGPRRVVNDDVDVTARSADEIIKLADYAARRKVTTKNALRQIGRGRMRKPDANGDCR